MLNKCTEVVVTLIAYYEEVGSPEMYPARKVTEDTRGTVAIL